MTHQTKEEEIEKLAEQLHEWYLEATNVPDAKYNHEAVVPYADLPEGSKLLDRYIAEKLLATYKAHCVKEALEEVLFEGKMIDTIAYDTAIEESARYANETEWKQPYAGNRMLHLGWKIGDKIREALTTKIETLISPTK